MSFATLLFMFFSSIAFADTNDICEILNIKNCAGVTKQLRRTTFPTAPSTTTAINLNPANVSFDKGLGLDIMYQPKNPLFFGLTSGTGRMGGALISGSIENSFFGNRAPERLEDLESRYKNDQRYQNKKISFAYAFRLLSSKSYGLDAGFILKRHPEIKRINPGVGASGRLWKIHFGVSTYQDDAFIPEDATLGPEYKERFTVTTYTVGTRLGNFAFDYGSIRSKLDFYGKPTNISLFSAAFHTGNFLFSAAMRQEKSLAPIYKDGELADKENKSSMYGGIQYSLNNHIIFGLHYNYFLMKEGSFSLSLFI